MEKYQFNGTPEDFRQAIIDMKRAGYLDETGAGLDSPRKKRVIDRRGTSIYYEALGRDGNTLLSVAGDDVQTWDIIRNYLDERQWVVQPVIGRVQDARLHPYADPATIKNGKHRKVVERLIERHLGRNKMTNKEIEDEAGVARSVFYAVQKRYTLYEDEAKAGKAD